MKMPDVATVRDPERAFQALDLLVRRRLDGLLQGDHAGMRLGAGSEAEEVVRYRPGEDDVRRIDWNVTARSLEPHVWRPRADHELESWVLLDETPSMAFGTTHLEKGDLGGWAAAAVGMLTDGPGNRVGLARWSADGIRWEAPLPGRVTARRVVRTIGQAPRTVATGSVTSFAEALTALERRARRPGVRVVVSDFVEPDGRVDRPFDWEVPLRRLAARHDVVVVEVLDPRELDLPDMGLLVLVDPETGRQREVWTSPRLRARYAEAAARHRASVATAVRGAGAAHVSPAHRHRLGARPRPVRPHPPPGAPGSRPEDAVTFLSPWWLLLIVPVLALLVAYVVAQRRRQRYAVRFASLPMLDSVAPDRPGWRRHAPATAFVLALSTLALAAARPEMDIRVPHERATVIVAIDVSRSMEATDVTPNRLDAARAAAATFVEGPARHVQRRGRDLLGDHRRALAEPTTDHAAVIARLQTLSLADSTAIGEAVFTSLDQVAAMAARSDDPGGSAGGGTQGGDGEDGEDGEEVDVPARIVLLSDGSNTQGREPAEAAVAATEAGVPVSTIAYGTDPASSRRRAAPSPCPSTRRRSPSSPTRPGGRPTPPRAATS